MAVFPPPWSAKEITANRFVVIDANGQQLAYVYYECEPGRRSAAKLLTKDEVRRIAVNIAQSCRSWRVEADNGAGFDVRLRG